MRRFQLIEIEDQSWLPNGIRDALTDYLQSMTDRTKPYSPIAPKLERAVELSRAKHITDLCSGGAGSWVSLQKDWRQAASMKILLTDKFPNVPAFQQAKFVSNGAIDFASEAVDAANVPEKLDGFRKLFAAFHHFRPVQARAILKDAVEKRQGIAVFEATHRSALAIALMFLLPFMALIFTPLFVRCAYRGCFGLTFFRLCRW